MDHFFFMLNGFLVPFYPLNLPAKTGMGKQALNYGFPQRSPFLEQHKFTTTKENNLEFSFVLNFFFLQQQDFFENFCQIFFFVP